MTANEHPIVFFDGECAMCSAGVRWIIRHDRRGTLRLAPLQGQTYSDLPDLNKPTTLDSMVFVAKDGQFFVRSAAVVRVLWALGGVWRVFGWLLWLVPAPIRDAGYRLVATHRHRLMRSDELCPIPTAEERSRLLP